MKKAIIVDLDGTLCNHSHRQHHWKKDWAAYSAGISEDKINKPIEDLVIAMALQGYAILLVTGRFEAYRHTTVQWLDHHLVPYRSLHMRPDGDMRPDSLIKEEIWARLVGTYDISFVVDDRKRVVSMWRSLGLTCLQCAEGDY